MLFFNMQNDLNTSFKIHQEIYDIKQQIEKKESIYILEKECLDNHKEILHKINNDLAETNLCIRSIDNYLSYNPDISNNINLLSSKNDYEKDVVYLNEQLIYTQNNVDYIENVVKKLESEILAHIQYIEDLHKMIPRINRWGNIENMSESELDIEAYRNNYYFELQLSGINDPPPKLVRQ